ncbi:PAS domain S-box protein, partial [Clostridium perfringens]
YMTSRLREALSQNEEEKEKLASILTNMSAGVIATDEAGRVILMNRRAGEMLGVEGEELAGHDIVSLLGLEESESEALALSEGHDSKLLEIVPHEGSEPFMMRVTFTPIHRREIGITGTIAVLQDVTEQEKLEASRREFVANVSHE